MINEILNENKMTHNNSNNNNNNYKNKKIKK